MNRKLTRIGICDDDIKICSFIENTILKYCEKAYELVSIDVYYSAESLFKDLECGTVFDLIFLDIELGGISGIQIGHYIREVKKNEATQIIYISSYKKYALDLFKIRPMDFLIKPINVSMICQALKTGIRLTDKNEVFFQYKLGRNFNKEYLKNILYFKSKDREVEMVTNHGKITFYGALQEIYKELKEFRFFFAHKSYLINYIHVTEFYFDRLVMSNGDIINVAQTRRKEVREIQKEYLIKELNLFNE